MVRGRAIRRHIHQKRRRSAIIEEVLRHAAGAAVVGRLEAAIEVGQQVDVRAVVLARRKDTGDLDADVGLGVVADDGGVDEEREEGVLVLGRVLLEQGGGVVVADGDVGGALGGDDADEGEGGEGELHRCCAVACTGPGREVERGLYWYNWWREKQEREYESTETRVKTVGEEGEGRGVVMLFICFPHSWSGTTECAVNPSPFLSSPLSCSH